MRAPGVDGQGGRPGKRMSTGGGGFTRVPAWVYSDEEIYRRELDTFFAGDSWNFVGLECELPGVGDFKRAWIGNRQVVVVRDGDGVNVLENRCAHRGGAIC